MIAELKEIISSDNIVFFGGAGVSTESGIPISGVLTDCTAKYKYPPEADGFTVSGVIPRSSLIFI